LLRDRVMQTFERRLWTVLEGAVWRSRAMNRMLGRRDCADLKANLMERATKTHRVRPKYGGRNKDIGH
jgi:hypothetical protein